jgi:hypothetical protein
MALVTKRKNMLLILLDTMSLQHGQQELKEGSLAVLWMMVIELLSSSETEESTPI